MKHGRTWMALSLALVMLASLLAACGPSTQQEAAGNKQEGELINAAAFGEATIAFSFYGNYDWYTMPPWGKDLATKWIRENKKVEITAISSGGNAKQKLNTMIASDELPDVIWLERGADVERLRAADLLVPLDEYLDKYPNLKKWAGESTLNMLRSPDGKIYQFPNWYTTQPNGNAGYVVNKKIYMELGSPKLETTDDLYAYLKKVKQNYPNAVPLEVGSGAEGVEILTSAFAENRPSLFNVMQAVPMGDELTSIFTDPVFREAMVYASRLFRERLMSQDTMSQTRDQLAEKIVSGRVAVLAGSSPTEFASRGDNMLRAEDPDDGYMMVWPLRKEGLDKNKIYPGDFKQLGWNVSVITKAADNPEATFAFLDWLTGPEGQRIIFWGPEGLYWEGTDADDAPIFTEKFTTDIENRNKLMDSTINFQWNGNTVYVDTSKSKFEQTLPEEKRNWETRWQTEITWKTQYNGTEFVNLDPPGDTEEGIAAQSIADIYSETRAKILLNAKSDDDVLRLLDEAETKAQQVGYAKLLAYKTEKWQENVKKLK
ncbi:extracellular solute-binding protein [Paenibacillus profundus]|uniref:Extracellular solute-binding protein n=1 Tax=Paenibacillus profundus TaxID=1173085 RepID=A0ABS8YES9_9BACL|nr:extracellular solute-binding protein [Paenibacillus profundus]MCE5170508.1 extracellular solute-binding protein [Paenibacillus profundus]